MLYSYSECWDFFLYIFSPCLFSCVAPRVVFNFYGWIACILKLTQWSKWVFTHSCRQEVIPLHFRSTARMCRILYSAVGSVWIDWPLTFCSCSLWCKFPLNETQQRVLFPKKSHLPSLAVWRHFGPAPGFRPQRATPLFEGWHFIRTIFGSEYGWVATGYRSIPSCVNTVLSVCFFSPFLSSVTERHWCSTSIGKKIRPRCSYMLQISIFDMQEDGFRRSCHRCGSRPPPGNSKGRVGNKWKIWFRHSDLCLGSWSVCQRWCFSKSKWEGRMEIPEAPRPLRDTLSAAHHRRLLYQA